MITVGVEYDLLLVAVNGADLQELRRRIETRKRELLSEGWELVRVNDGSTIRHGRRGELEHLFVRNTTLRRPTSWPQAA